MEIAESDLLITIINYILDFLKALFIIEYSSKLRYIAELLYKIKIPYIHFKNLTILQFLQFLRSYNLQFLYDKISYFAYL